MNVYKRLTEKLYKKNKIYKNFVKAMEKNIDTYVEAKRIKDNKAKDRVIKKVLKIIELLRVVEKDKTQRKFSTYKQISIFNIENKDPLTEFRKFLLKNRTFYPKQNKIIQHLDIDLSTEAMFRKNIKIKNQTLLSDKDDKNVGLFNRDIQNFVDSARNKIFKDKDIIDARIKFQYFTMDPKDVEYDENKKMYSNFIFKKDDIRHTADFYNLRTVNVNNEVKRKFMDSKTIGFFIGYTIIYFLKQDVELKKKQLTELIAYSPSSNRKFHELTTASTSVNKICIYETFLQVSDIKSLRYMHKNKVNHDKIMQRLREEGKDIEDLVKNGKLVQSLELLTKKYDTKVDIVYYNKDTDDVIRIDRGNTSEVKKSQLEHGQQVFLYELDRHVAPSIYTNKLSFEQKQKKQKKTFILKSQDVKVMDNVKNILGFDTETYTDENNMCHVFNVTIYGKLNDKDVAKSFYGENCIGEFVKYIDKISTKVNYEKSRPKNAVSDIYIYGFNNSRFDNLLIYMDLYKLNPATKYVFAGNSIKCMQYNNIRFYDISLQYKMGDLRTTAKKGFKIEEEKGVYPYRFPNKDNLDYIDVVPELCYWNSKEDRDEYIRKEGCAFFMKDYTEKYCMLDSKLVYKMAVKHIEMAQGTLNGRKYNCINCPTSANLALKMFKQVFLKQDLKQSPDKIIENEHRAYKGGRTEVFKKEFKSIDNKKLLYLDINSAHPSGMLKNMPYEYLATLKHDNKLGKIDEIVDYNLYFASSEYKGTKNIIPNLLIKQKATNLSALKTDYDWHWGIEIKEAIKIGFEIRIMEEHAYSFKPVFSEFAQYFYNERLKIKKTNEVLSLFYKAILNSLYGKFGQRVFTKTALCDDMKDVAEKLKSNFNLMKGFEVIGDKIMIEYEEENDEYECIGKLMRFASYITATTRTKLSEIMREIGFDHIYYCDTDSIFTDKHPPGEFMDNTILGKWKIETDSINRAIFLAPKVYTYTDDNDTERKAKGLKAEKITDEEYNELHENGTVIKKKDIMFMRSLTGVKIIPDQERTLNTVYNKRIWSGNNSKTFPVIPK